MKPIIAAVLLASLLTGCTAMTPQNRAASRRQADAARALIDAGADLNARDNNGWTLLTSAASSGHADVVKLLLGAGADVNARSVSGSTPLSWAVTAGHADVAKLLIGAGADVNAQDKDGWTLLHWAASSGHADVAKVLLDGGADVNARDKDGSTPLRMAMSWGHADAAKVLVAAGADVNARDNDGRTPQDYAAARKSAAPRSENHETAEKIGEGIKNVLLAPVVVGAAVVVTAYKLAEASAIARYGGAQTVETVGNAPETEDNTPSYGVDSEGRPWSCVGSTCSTANTYIPPDRRPAFTSPGQ